MCDEKAMLILQRQVQRLTATLANLGMGAMQGYGFQQPVYTPKMIMNGSTMPSQVPGACGGQQYCPPSLVSPATDQAIRSGPRTAHLPVVGFASLAAGASVTLTVASNSIERTLVITDLVSTISSLDGVRVRILVGDATTGREVDSFNGGRFARGNANDCTTACGFGACVGPIETLTLIVTNTTGAAFAATDTMRIDVRSIYRGEDGFSCGDCIQPGTLPGGTFPYPGSSDSPVG